MKIRIAVTLFVSVWIGIVTGYTWPFYPGIIVAPAMSGLAGLAILYPKYL